MSVQLDPAVVEKLQALAKRRRVMLLIRGAFATILALLTAMALVALVDRLIVLGQSARIALSLAGYGVVMAVLYVTCLRYLLRIPSRQQLAKLVEEAEPGLHEQVVSAVELSGDDPNAFDSDIFRAILQRNVGRRIQQVDAQRILPWRMIAWWVGVSTFAALLTVALLFVPGLRYGQLLTRAMLPTANTDRVSTIEITLLSPGKADATVPMNEHVAVVVEVAGGTLERVELDVLTGDETRPERITMAGEKEPNRYRLDLLVQDEPVQFRVVAGDGRTRYYTLTPAMRPHVVAFTQVIRHPDYTGREPTRLTADHGTITALAGSVIELTLTTDQPVDNAQLTLELPASDTGTQHIELTADPGDATRLHGSIILDQSGSYRVQLVARATGFDNPQSPRYELSALNDELPRVTLDKPTGMIGLPADALMRLRGSASDDVGLHEVRREMRINGNDWIAVTLPVSPTGRIAQPIDLADVDLTSGDMVELRLAATDLAGNTAHSISAQLVVTPDGIRPADAQHANDTAALLAAVNRLKQTNGTLAERYESTRDAAGGDAIAARQSATQALTARDDVRAALDRVQAALTIALSTAPAGRASEALVRVGRLIAQVEGQQSLLPAQATDAEGYRDAARLARRHAWISDQAVQTLRPMLAAEQAQLALYRLGVLRDDLNRMARDAEVDRSIREDLAWQRLQRRLAVNGRQTEQAADLLAAAARRTQDGLRDNTQNAADDLRDQGVKLYEQAEASALGPELLQLIGPQSERLAGSLRHTHQLVDAVIRSESDRYRDRQPGERPDADQLVALRDGLPQADEDISRAMVWIAGTHVLSERARLEELRPQPDLPFVTDTSRAVSALSQFAREDATTGQTPPGLDTLINAYHIIERAHVLEQLHAAVVNLAVLERSDVGADRLAATHRREWLMIDRRLEVVADLLKQRRTLRPAGERVQQARHSNEANALRQEAQRRRDANHQPVPRPDELDALARMLDEAIALLEEPLADARQDLVDQSQSLPERLRDLAQEQERVEEQTRAAAEQAQDKPTAENRERAQELAQQQAQFQERLNEVVDEMRRQANQEDLLTQEGRERARDVDDAIAMLKPDVLEARQRLEDAQQEPRAVRQQDALEDAARAQEETAQTLRDLADHFENVDNGDEQAENQSRDELRSNERELGVDQQLDEQFDRMERLAELAQTDDAQRLEELEEQLRQDPAMRDELDEIADEAVEQAGEQLEAARAQEEEVAQDLAGEARERDQQQQEREERLSELAERARELNEESVEPLLEQANDGALEARDEARAAQEALEEAGQQGEPDAQQQREVGERAEQADRSQELAQQAREAADQLAQAEQEAGQAVEEAEARREEARRAAERANEQGDRDDRAAQRAVEAAQERVEARRTQQRAQEAAAQAEQLAQDAEQLAQEEGQQSEQSQQQREQAAQQQQPIGEQVGEASQNIERAARHQERLGNEQQQEQLEQAAQDTEQLAQDGLPEAAEQIEGAPSNEQAAEQARDAEEQIAQQQQQLAQAQQQGEPGQQGEPSEGEQGQAGEQGEPGQGEPGEGEQGQPGEQGEPGQGEPGEGESQSGQPGQQGEPGQPGQGQPGQGQPSSPQVAQALAQELDALDQQLNQGAPGQAPGQRAIDQAAQHQEDAIRQQRNQQAQSLQPGQQGQGQPGPSQGQQPGSEQPGPSEGGGMANDQREAGALPDAGEGDSAWGDLPQRMTEDLSQGVRERAPADYADQVDAYFRAIAERARQQQQGGDE